MSWSKQERRKRRKGCSSPRGFTMRQFCRNQLSRSRDDQRTNEELLRRIIRELMESDSADWTDWTGDTGDRVPPAATPRKSPGQ